MRLKCCVIQHGWKELNPLLKGELEVDGGMGMMRKIDIWQNTKGKWYRGHAPFFLFLVFVLIGIFCSKIIPVHPTIHTWVILLLHFSGFSCVVGLVRPIVLFPSLILFFILYAWMQCWKEDPRILFSHFAHHSPQYLIGWLEEEPRQNEKSTRVRARILGGVNFLNEKFGEEFRPLTGSLLLTIEKPISTPLKYGNLLVFSAQANQRIPPPRNPDEMDYAKYMANRGCWHQTYITSSQIQLLSGFFGNRLVDIALRYREDLVSKFERFLPDKDAFAIASTLILGYRSDLSSELIETYAATGTIHVLSVSGMHVVIVFWMLAKILYIFDYSPALKRIRFFIIVLCIWLYALMTGFSPSVLRAAGMITLYLSAEILNRKARSYHSISASAFILLLIRPSYAFEVGFQLSYLAVFGIVFFSPFFANITYTLAQLKSKWVRPVVDYSLMSLAAQTGTFTIATYYFNQFPVYFLLSNLLIVIPATLLMYMGFAVLFIPEIHLFEGVLRALGEVLNWMIIWMNQVLSWIQSLPGSQLKGLNMDVFESISILFLMVGVVLSLQHRSKLGIYLCAFIAICLSFSTALLGLDRVPQRTLIFHQMKQQIAVTYVDAEEAWVISNLDSVEHPTIRYSVLPYLINSAPARGIQWYTYGLDYDSPKWKIRFPFLFLEHYTVLLMDEKMEDERLKWLLTPSKDALSQKILVDLLFIRNGRNISLNKMLNGMQVKQIVMDASNPPWVVNRIKAEAKEHQVPVYNMKNNFAYVWSLGKSNE